MSYITTVERKECEGKVVLTIEEINGILKHHHSEAMGGHSGSNATLDVGME